MRVHLFKDHPIEEAFRKNEKVAVMDAYIPGLTMRTTASFFYLKDGSLLQFQIETYAQVIEDIKPLLERHWQEIAVYDDIALSPDFEFYANADKLGMMAVYTARLNGKLIGYAIYFIRKGHHHYQEAGWAVSDIILVLPEHRNTGVATGLFDLIESDLEARGISVMHTTAKTAHPQLSAFLEARGHAMIEKGHSKRLR